MDKNPQYVADIGCGPGEMLIDLMKRGHKVVGVDIAIGMLHTAAENIAKAQTGKTAYLQCGNIECLPFKDNSFDTVISAGVIEYLNTDGPTLKELNRILKPGGTLIITVRNKACPFRIFDVLLDLIKETRFGKQTINRLLKSFKKGPLQFIQYRKHIPWTFDRTLRRFGLEKTAFRYFHFYPFFTPLDKFIPGFYIKNGLKMEKYSDTRLGVLASGYIVKAQKKRNIV
jgi:ubiquinone/menaquinone biosynthesis C-methylase UbiE